MEMHINNQHNNTNSNRVIKNTSFLLRIKYNQNHTIQGSIQWIENKKTVCFRSLMELIILLKEAAQFNTDIRTWVGDNGLIEEIHKIEPTGSDSRSG